MRLLRICGLALAALVLLNASTAYAQIPTGVIDGTALDPDGQPLPGVTVTITGAPLMAARVVYTGPTGGFRVPALPPGFYTVTASLSGFNTVVISDIRVTLNTTSTVQLDLRLASVEETVTVTSEVPVIDVRTTNVGVNMTDELLQNIPNARDVWVVLEEVPGIVMDRFNVGGNKSGQQSSFSAGGGTSQNAYNFDGVDITDMAATGAATYFPYDAFEEVQVSTQAHKAEVAAPGVFLNIVTRSGANDFHGIQAFYYEGPTLQANNIDQELEDAGVSEGDEFKRYLDFTTSLGGRIVRDKLWFYGTYQHQQPEVYPIGFTRADGSRGVDSTQLRHYLGKLDWQMSDNHKLSGSAHYGTKDRPWRNPSSYANMGTGTLWDQNSPKWIPQVHWNAIWGDRGFSDVSFGAMLMDFPLAPDEDNLGNPAMYEYLNPAAGFDRIPNSTFPWQYGYNESMYYYIDYFRDRYQAQGTYSYYQDGWWGQHDFKTGASWFTFRSTTDEYSFGGTRVGFRSGIPYNVRFENHPQQLKYYEDSFGFYLQDTWTVNTHLTLNLGVRADAWEVYLPDQASPDSPLCGTLGGSYPEFCARSFDAIPNIVDWLNLAPRLGVIYDVFGDGRTALKANYSRYYNQVGNWVADYTNPNGYTYLYYRWADANGDDAWQPGEEAASPYSAYSATANMVDPNLKQPLTDEWVVGVDQEVGRNFAVGATFTYRQDKQMAEDMLNTIPLDAYTPVTFADSNVPGGSFIAYDLAEEWVGSTEGWIITNPDFINGQKFENTYKAFTVRAVKRWTDNWQMLGSYTWSKTLGFRTDGADAASAVGDNPNADLFAYGRPFYDRPHLFKVSGNYIFPYGINAGAFLRVQSGQPYARTIETPVSLNQGYVTVRVEEPGSQRLDTVSTLDIRASKIFELPLGNLEVMFDVFNLFNSNTVIDKGNEIYVDINTIYEILGPRIARFGVKWDF
jgi:outer membrane receptor protein involved in Fe transport